MFIKKKLINNNFALKILFLLCPFIGSNAQRLIVNIMLSCYTLSSSIAKLEKFKIEINLKR